jgi:hypothetical protein
VETAFHESRKQRISPGLSIVRRPTNGRTAAKIVISERQQKLLEEFSKSRRVGKCIVQRATIILLGFTGMLNEEIARQVGLGITAFPALDFKGNRYSQFGANEIPQIRNPWNFSL